MFSLALESVCLSTSRSAGATGKRTTMRCAWELRVARRERSSPKAKTGLAVTLIYFLKIITSFGMLWITSEYVKGAVPQCDTDCPHGGSQICGTDGRTYANRCVMRMQSCRAGTFVRKDYNGPCRTWTNNLVIFYRLLWWLSFVGLKGSFGSEQCMTNCPTNNSPVCGSDGKTYANECFMRAESCIERTFVTKSYDGACRT